MRGIKKIGAIDLYVAEKIKKFRLQKGVSLEELAMHVGVSLQQMQKYEKAENKINAGNLFQVAHTLNKPIAAFFEGFKINGKFYRVNIKSEAKRKKEDAAMNKDLLPLIRAYNMIESKKVRRQITNLAREIAGPYYRKKTKHQFS